MKPLLSLPSADRAVSFWTCCLLVAACESQAQIIGKVADGTGRPLEGVSVRVIGSNFQTTTNQAGAYRLDYVPGTFQVGFSKDHHTSACLPLSLSVKDRYPAETAILYRLPTRPGIAYFDDSAFVELTEKQGMGMEEERPTIGTNFTQTLLSTRYIVGRKERGVGLPSTATGRFIDNSPRRSALFRVPDNGVFLTRDQSLMDTEDKMDIVPLTASQIALGVYLRKPAVPLTVGKYAFAALSEDTRAPLGWRNPSLNTAAPIGLPLHVFEVFDPAERKAGKMGQPKQAEGVSGTWIAGDDLGPPVFFKIVNDRELLIYDGRQLTHGKLAKDTASGEFRIEFPYKGTMHSGKIRPDRELLWVEVEGGQSSLRRYFGDFPKFGTQFGVDANGDHNPLASLPLGTVVALRIALADYRVEYSSYPLPQPQGEADVMIPTGPPLISSLGAGRSSAQGNRSNPKGINFLSVIFVGETGARNLKPEGDGDHLRDDWGNHFLVFLDANQNGSLEIQVSQKRLNVASPIAVWCLGPNGVFDGQEGDDTYVY